MTTTDNTVIETRGWKFDVRDGCVYVRKDNIVFYCDSSIAGEPVVECWSEYDPEE